MRTIFDYISANWSLVIIPASVFIVSLIALFWLRKRLLDWLERGSKKLNWSVGNTLIFSLRGPFSILCLIFSIYLGLAVSSISGNWRVIGSNVIWSLLNAAITLTLLNITNQMIFFYGKKLNQTDRVTRITQNVVRLIILVVAVLVLMGTWGVPTSPLLLLIAVVILIALVAFRDAAPNLFASLNIAASQVIKVGDYIKLEDQEEGYVTRLHWNTTQIKGLDGSVILIPNSALIRRKVINYGRPLKKATEPFVFNTHVHLAELTGLKARNLKVLLEVLKTVPEPVIYYHTHHALEENQYFHPELSNDFSNWVKNALDDNVLAEKLANLSTFEFKSLLAFRDHVVEIIEEHVTKNQSQREAPEGQDFYFMKSVSVILPTAYKAGDLREFVEALRKISPGSLYFHIFESRLRLGNQLNDFSVWLGKNLVEEDLSQEIARIDPHTYTLEGLRSLLIQTIEKRIK